MKITYWATLPDRKLLTVDCGGNADDIYSYWIEASKAEKVVALQPHAGAVYDEYDLFVEGFFDY